MPRKTRQSRVPLDTTDFASMRPRPDAAENSRAPAAEPSAQAPLQ